MSKEKFIYCGTLNWYGEIYKLYTNATSEAQAKSNVFKKFAEKVNRNICYIKLYYRNRPLSYEIKHVRESK